MKSARHHSALILDRDGVINEDSDHFIKSREEWIPIPGSLDAIARLSCAGFRVAIATNQSGIARGLLTMSQMNAIHHDLAEQVAARGGRIEMIAYCPHGPDQNCSCRKPKPGLLEEIASRMGIGLAGVPFIGDSLRDIEAARVVGASPWLVLTGKGQQTLTTLMENAQEELLLDLPVFRDLASLADMFLRQSGAP